MLSRTVKYAFFLFLIVFLSFTSCKQYFNKEEKQVLARVGEDFLYGDDISNLVQSLGNEQDSAIFVSNYINNWAKKKLLVEKAKINLSDNKLREYDQLVEDYRADLYTMAYVDALVSQANDTTIRGTDVINFYESRKESLRLSEALVQLHFVVLPLQFLNKGEVVQRLKRFEEGDKIYLDSLSVQFKKLHLNDSIWVASSRLMDEIPPFNFRVQQRYLKNSQFFEFQDSLGVYLGRIVKVLEKGEPAPLEYVAPNIRQLILNKRRMDFINQLEAEILQEALQKRQFELYGER